MDLTLISIAAFGLAIMLIGVWVYMLDQRLKKLLSGKDAGSLEGTINENRALTDELLRFRKSAEEEFSKLDQRLRKKLHGAKTLRFNPFAGTGSGGNQSFATALVDEEGDGVVISTLYSREKVSVFAKPVKGNKSEFELTDEEKEVLR